MNRKHSHKILILFLLICSACISESHNQNNATFQQNQLPTNEGSRTENVLNVFYEQIATSLPINPNDFVVISAFGSRLQDGVYDFHRGIDFEADLGDAVFNIADGQLYRVYPEGSSSFPNSGNTVVIEHTLETPFDFQGHEVTRYYTIYSHLDRFSQIILEAHENNQTPTVSANQTLGYAGQTGSTNRVHLHFEIRLQTLCSLEYQLENPSASCAQYAFDPHINPMPLFFNREPSASDYRLDLNRESQVLTIDFYATRAFFDFEEVEIVLYESEDQQNLITQKVLNFTTREGLNAISEETLDESLQNDINITPFSLGANQSYYHIRFSLTTQNWPEAQYAIVRTKSALGFFFEETLSWDNTDL